MCYCLVGLGHNSSFIKINEDQGDCRLHAHTIADFGFWEEAEAICTV